MRGNRRSRVSKTRLITWSTALRKVVKSVSGLLRDVDLRFFDVKNWFPQNPFIFTWLKYLTSPTPFAYTGLPSIRKASNSIKKSPWTLIQPRNSLFTSFRVTWLQSGYKAALIFLKSTLNSLNSAKTDSCFQRFNRPFPEFKGPPWLQRSLNCGPGYNNGIGHVVVDRFDGTGFRIGTAFLAKVPTLVRKVFTLPFDELLGIGIRFVLSPKGLTDSIGSDNSQKNHDTDLNFPAGLDGSHSARSPWITSREFLKLSLRSRSLRSATAVSSWVRIDSIYSMASDSSTNPLIDFARLDHWYRFITSNLIEPLRLIKNLDPVWFVYSICILAFSRISATQKPLTQSRCRTSFSATHHSRETRSDMKNFCAAVANCVAQSFEAFLRLFEISLIKKLEGGEGVATPPPGLVRFIDLPPLCSQDLAFLIFSELLMPRPKWGVA